MIPYDQPREIPDPTDALSCADADEYHRLQESFRHSQNSGVRDRRGNSFKNEIETIIRFVDHRPEDREKRALATGLIRTGSYLCVNSQRLKSFVCRCKSSINNGFQQLGFESVKSRSKSNGCLAASLPSLSKNYSSLSRQWTVRSYEPSFNKSINPVHPAASTIIKPDPMESHRETPTESAEQNHVFNYANTAMHIERPKSAAPFVRPMLPVPIFTSKSPLPIPKINAISMNQLTNNQQFSRSTSDINPSADFTQTSFLLDIAPPLQEEFFPSWESGIQSTDQIVSSQFSRVPSQTDSSFSSPNTATDVSFMLSPTQDSLFSLDQPSSLDLNPFDEGFSSFQD